MNNSEIMHLLNTIIKAYYIKHFQNLSDSCSGSNTVEGALSAQYTTILIAKQQLTRLEKEPDRETLSAVQVEYKMEIRQ